MTARPDELTHWLAGRVGEYTGRRPDEIDVDLPLRELGISSVTAAELVSDLAALLDRPVDPAKAFEYPTIRALASALAGTVRANSAPRQQSFGTAIAITGMSVRVPGADSSDQLWHLLRSGKEAIAEPSPERWRLAPGSLTDAERGAAFAGLLSDIASFDAEFFRIPREEAIRMDPQQRLLLQGTWEALEDAGQLPARLRGSNTGVYVGICNSDYARRQLDNPPEAHALALTGNALSVAANRLSYQFDFRGPSLALDTACSSSLVAVHLAVRDMRSGTCDLAVAGGVNLLIEPGASVALARAGMLASDGRCKPFDAAANGYVRGEGCIVVILKPLDRAIAEGDRVYAVILGSHVNHDGRTNGLTSPNPAAQEAVLRAAYADARVDPRSVQYVECQGTGSLLGDYMEARALGSVVGAGRPATKPCLIGSIKSNFGNLESAAGMAGLVKAALSVHRGLIPASLHFHSANPYIDFAEVGLRVAVRESALPADGRLVGVSSFGFGGTNAHVVLGGAADASSRVGGPAVTAFPRGPVVLPLSARHPQSLAVLAHAVADQLEELLETDQEGLQAVAGALSVRRTHHSWRYAAVGATAAELAAEFRKIHQDELAEVRSARRLVFAFSGESAHRPTALLALAEANPLAAATLRRCDEVIKSEAGWSLLEVLSDPGESALVSNAELAQPAVVAAQLTLAAAWQGVGIRPDEVIGHGVGEVAAAAVAGALSLAQAIRVALARGHVIGKVIGNGMVLALSVSEQQARKIAASAGGRVTAAVVDGRTAVVLSGDAEALEQVRACAEANGMMARWVPVPYTSNSPLMADAAAELMTMLNGLEVADPALPFWSSTEAGALTVPLDAAFWGRNLASPARFADAASAMLTAGTVAVVELDAHPFLRPSLTQLAAEASADRLAFVSTEPGRDAVRQFRADLARLYEVGADPRWERLAPTSPYRPVPTYPWRRTRYWLPRQEVLPGAKACVHPLLGRKLDLASAGRRLAQWELRLSSDPSEDLAGQVANGQPVLSAAALLEMALAAGRQLGIKGPIEVRDARFKGLLPLVERPVTVQTIAESRPDRAFNITIASSQREGDWRVKAVAVVSSAASPIYQAQLVDPASARARCGHAVATGVGYDRLRSLGLNNADGHRSLDDIWYGDGSAVAALADPPNTSDYVVDPRTLEGALQLTVFAFRLAPRTRLVLQAVRRLVVAAQPAANLTAVATARDGSGEASVTIFAGQQPAVAVEMLQVKSVAVPATDAGTARSIELAPASEISLHDLGFGPSRAGRSLEQSYAAPRNELERLIAGIWERSFGLSQVGIFDGFFELGGDSLFANQMLFEVNRALGVEVTATDAFNQLTVAHLAELAEQHMIRRLESMSDEEAEQLLHEGDGG
jgi:acyl transferase domain-containing protein